MPLRSVRSRNLWESMAKIYYVPDKESMQAHTVIIFGFSSSSTPMLPLGSSESEREVSRWKHLEKCAIARVWRKSRCALSLKLRPSPLTGTPLCIRSGSLTASRIITNDGAKLFSSMSYIQ